MKKMLGANHFPLYFVNLKPGAAMIRQCLTAILLSFVLASAVHAACLAPENQKQLQADVIAGINANRAAQGLGKLVLSAKLDRAAQGLACDNANSHSFSHVSANGATLADRYRAVGYGFTLAAENTGRGFHDAATAVAFWMNSSGHRQNILTPGMRDVGVGIAVSAAPENRLHWVIDFGTPR